MTIDNSASLNNKRFSDKTKNPIKKAHCISNKTFVVIDDRLVERLKIDKENTWFEQEQIEDGILLRIHGFSTIKEDLNDGMQTHYKAQCVNGGKIRNE
jgi:hypothetical protein